MQQISFNGSGPALSIGIKYSSTSGQNINAVYTYRLWAATSNAVISEHQGNNMNDEDDVYWLPTPSIGNDGRIIELFSTLKNNDSNPTPLRIEVEVCQGGATIATVTDQMELPGEAVQFSQFFIQLKASA